MNTLFNGMQMNWTVYNEGFEAWDKYLETNIMTTNPYTFETADWYSWNKGWNSNMNGI